MEAEVNSVGLQLLVCISVCHFFALRAAAHTCMHSDRQYCRLRYPSLNTTSSRR